MSEEIKPGSFTSKYDLGEILELKQAGDFLGRVISVSFQEGVPGPIYGLRKPDGFCVTALESELCVKGVDWFPEDNHDPL